jgi:DinB family protein
MSKEAVSRETALARYDAEFDRWRSALDAVGMDRMDEPGVMGEWSARQLVAHLAGWQWKTLASMRTALSGGEYPPSPWPATFNDRDSWEEDGDVESVNQWIHDQAEPAPADEIVARSLQQWRDIRDIISSLDEARLNDPSLFPRLEGQSLGRVLADDVLSGHTREHLDDDLEPWLERNRRRSDGGKT